MYLFSLKRRILREINQINNATAVFTAAVIFISGVIITVHGISDIEGSCLVFPKGMPPTFFLILGRFFVHLMLGLTLGILLAAGDKYVRCFALRAAVFIALLVLCEMIWISVFYCFAIPFFSFILSVIMLFLALCACVLTSRSTLAASIILYVYFMFLLIRWWFSLSMVLIN